MTDARTQPFDPALDTYGRTCWYTTMCPHCENYVMATDGRIEWCSGCGEQRKYRSQAPKDAKGEGRRKDE